MLQTFSITLVQMLRLFALIALGFLFNKAHVVPRAAEEVLSKLTVVLFAPMLTLYTFVMQCTVDNLSQNFSYVLYGGALLVFGTLISYPLCRIFTADSYQRGVYRYAIAMPNTGAFCTPLVLAFFGVQGNFLKSLFLFAQTLLTYTWGTMQLQPQSRRVNFIGYLLKFVEPNFIALVCGIVLGLCNGGRWIPKIVLDNICFFGDCYVPFSLLVVGYCIADFPFYDIMPKIKTVVFTVIRMLVFPLSFIFLMILVKAPAMVVVLTALSFSNPCGMNTVVFPVAYGQDCREGASLVLFTSLLAVGLVPLIYAIAKMLVGM